MPARPAPAAPAPPALPAAGTKERLAALDAMSSAERRAIAHRGELTLAEACAWAARYPHEVELVEGEFWFIAQRQPECAEAT